MQTKMELKERAVVEKELSQLMETTLRLEVELDIAVNNE